MRFRVNTCDPRFASSGPSGAQDAAATQSRVEVIETTAHDPFRNATTATWTNATDLDPGDQLRDLPVHFFRELRGPPGAE